MTKDTRVDDFIANAQPFARPILSHLRELVHTACPEVEESIKWGMPHFGYKGMLCGLGSFKQHCAFNMFKFKEMKEAEVFEKKNAEAMGHLGKITSLQDLPDDSVIIAYIKEAMKLNENPVKKTKPKASAENKVLHYPDGVKAALEADARAGKTFENMSYSHQKEYIEWIAEAKTEATRSKRIATMIEWLKEGKHRNWKYDKR